MLSSLVLDPVFRLPIHVSTRKRGVLYCEVVRSNPNGDPDNQGAPRQLQDGRGWISNASIKRGIRDYVGREFNQALYVARGADLTAVQAGFQHDGVQMRKALWDLRPFGGVLTASADRVCGAVQFSDAVSLNPVEIEEIGGTRVGHHPREQDVRTADGDIVTRVKAGANMFYYKVVSYGVYRCEFTLDPFKAAAVGLTEADMEMLYSGLIEGFQDSRSAHRTGVNIRALYVFDSPTARGTEPSHVTAMRVKEELLTPEGESASRWEDYAITVDDNLPPGMTLRTWHDGVLGGTEPDVTEAK